MPKAIFASVKSRDVSVSRKVIRFSKSSKSSKRFSNIPLSLIDEFPEKAYSNVYVGTEIALEERIKRRQSDQLISSVELAE